MTRIGAILYFAAALVALQAGCHQSAMSRLDKEVERLLLEEHGDVLGPEAARDPQMVPGRLVAGGFTPSTYSGEPPTTNPLPADLPARPTTQPAPAPTTQPLDADVAPGALPRVTLTLEQALSYAIANSPEYRNRKANLFFVTIDLLIERHLWGPRFFNSVTAQVVGGGRVEAGDSQHAFEVLNTFEVRQRLPYGGQVNAGVVASYVEQLRTHASGSDRRALEVFLDATVPLLRGAGGSEREGLIQTQRNLVYAVREFEDFRRRFLVDVSTRYYDLLRAQTENQNREQQLKTFEWLTQRVAALANAGRIAPFEVQRSQQQELSARNNLINSLERYTAQLDAFKLVIGMPTVQSLDVEPVEIVIPEPELDQAESIEAALEYRLDLQTTGDRVEDVRRQVAIAHNQLLPDLDLIANVRTRNDSQDHPTSLSLDFGEPSYTAGVRFGVPLDRRIEKLTYREALIRHERARRDFRFEHDRVIQEVRSAIRAIQQARLTLELQSRNIRVNETRLRGVTLRLRELGTRDFTEAQNDLLEAQNRYDAALRDLRVSILQYLLATGQLRVTREGHWQPPGKLVAGRAAPEVPTPQEMLRGDDLDPIGD